MLLKIFSIRDQKSEVYNTPFFQRTVGEAERNFKKSADDQKTVIHDNPQDFDLYYLGDYDDNLGLIVPFDTPQHVAHAKNIQEQKNSG